VSLAVNLSACASGDLKASPALGEDMRPSATASVASAAQLQQLQHVGTRFVASCGIGGDGGMGQQLRRQYLCGVSVLAVYGVPDAVTVEAAAKRVADVAQVDGCTGTVSWQPELTEERVKQFDEVGSRLEEEVSLICDSVAVELHMYRVDHPELDGVVSRLLGAGGGAVVREDPNLKVTNSIQAGSPPGGSASTFLVAVVASRNYLNVGVCEGMNVCEDASP
jgi:hypothetical protein